MIEIDTKIEIYDYDNYNKFCTVQKYIPSPKPEDAPVIRTTLSFML